jgi:hypothetical protein
MIIRDTEGIMNGQDKSNNGLAGVFISAVFIILVIILDLFDAATGSLILLAYLLAAMLFMSGHYRILILGFSASATGLVVFLALAGDSLGILRGASSVIILLLWMVILAFVLEYFLMSGTMEFENIGMYRHYMLLNLAQSSTVLFSSVILMLGLHLSGQAVPAAIILNSCTILILLFFISFGLFTSYFMKSMFDPCFMSDFAKALYDMGRDMEYEDRRQGIKETGADYDFLKTFRRMRFITYLLFAASLASLFLISKTKVIDLYMQAAAGRNAVIDGIIYFIKNPPEALTVFLKIIFFMVDIFIIRDMIKMIGLDRLKMWLNILREPIQD